MTLDRERIERRERYVFDLANRARRAMGVEPADGDYVGYLVDAIIARRCADTDEYRALQALADAQRGAEATCHNALATLAAVDVDTIARIDRAAFGFAPQRAIADAQRGAECHDIGGAQ